MVHLRCSVVVDRFSIVLLRFPMVLAFFLWFYLGVRLVSTRVPMVLARWF